MASDTLAKIDMARVVVAELTYGKREWKGLHEPASEDATDVVIMEALRCAEREIARLTRELDAARAENRRLREALRDFGWHSKGCPTHSNPSLADECTCGFTAALTARRGEGGGE